MRDRQADLNTETNVCKLCINLSDSIGQKEIDQTVFCQHNMDLKKTQTRFSDGKNLLLMLVERPS